MVVKDNTEVDAYAYWWNRVAAGSDRGAAGCREELDEMLNRHVTRRVEELRARDVGFVSDLYTGCWAEQSAESICRERR